MLKLRPRFVVYIAALALLAGVPAGSTPAAAPLEILAPALCPAAPGAAPFQPPLAWDACQECQKYALDALQCWHLCGG
jgi:hypothetical protein